MKKRMKRPLAVLLALIMMFSTVSGTGLNLSAEELPVSGAEILTTEDSGAATEEDKSGDAEDINQEDAPEEGGESEGDELTESEESEDAAESSGDSKTEDKSDPVTEPEDDADDGEDEKTEAPAEITRYDYKSDEVNVLVTLTDPADLPDAAELVVEPITLQREAQKNIEEAAAEEGIFVEEIKAFDIKFMLDGEEVQPGATVKVSVSVPEFKPSEEASAVYHVDENNEVENMESEVAADGEVVFDAPHFSTYVIVDGSIINDATKVITVTLKHYKKDGYSASTATSPTETYKLYLDDEIEVPVGGEIYNYIKADNWKPDTVVVDYESATDVTYANSADLKEISLTDNATVWVYYTPDQSSFYGEVGFYDYTVYTENEYSINNVIDNYLSDDSVKNILIVGDAKYDNRPYQNSKYYIAPKTKQNYNRGSQPYEIEIFGQEFEDDKIKYLDENGNVLFRIPQPGLFDATPLLSSDGEYLREYYSDYQVGFTRSGNTYTFDQVLYPYEGSIGYYNKGDSWQNGGNSDGENFFPLDYGNYSQEQSPSSKKDSNKHNRFWGMRYDVTFTIGDYVGDMTFKSKTKNDFLVILDGEKLVVKSEGTKEILKSEVDLWKCLFGGDFDKSNLNSYQEELEKEHTLTVLYMDRFANNGNDLDSVCSIEFTLPNAKLKEVVKLDENDEITQPETTSMVIKTIDQSGNFMIGASFQLKNTSTAATETLTITEAEAGVTFKGLTVGEYQLMLANAPDNCVADVNEWKVIIEDQDGNLIISMIEEETGKTVTPTDGIYLIGVTKVIGTKLVLRTVSNKEGDSPLGGARFKLESNGTAEEKYSETKTSDFATGEISFNGLSDGNYMLTHVKAPKGCQLKENVSEWLVTITESQGSYSISMTNKAADEDGVYVYKYEVNEKEYVKPEEALTYDKTAKVVDWDERTYEIDISATALETESIQQIDTTYGMFVFDKSSSMFDGLPDKAADIGKADSENEFKDVKADLDKNVVYRVRHTGGSYGDAADYIFYRQDNGKNDWYMYSCSNNTWTKMEDSTKFSNSLRSQNLKFDLLRDVAVSYVKNLFENAPQSKIGITTFHDSSQCVKELTSVSDDGGTFNQSILEEIFKIRYEKQGTCLGNGLELAYNEFFDIKRGETESAYEIAKNRNIPMYVIAVSDGDVDDQKKSEQFARALKDKGIKVYTIVTDTAGSDKDFLKRIASFGCAYETSDVRQLSDIFSQIQKEVSVSTYTNITVKDGIDDRFVILDDDENETPITKEYYDEKAEDVCINDCESACTCNFKAIKVERGEKTGFVYYDENGKQYIQWVNQTISETENNWSIKVKAREDYIGGNNVTTNIAADSMIKTANKEYKLPNPTVNVKVDLKVDDHVYMLYKGEKVPTNDDVLNELFDRSSNSKYSKEAFVKYGIMKSVDGTDPISLNWYSDKACTEPVNLLTEKADSSKSYYLKVTYDTSEPSNESNANTTDSAGVVHYVGTANGSVYRQDAVNENDAKLSYGTYKINVWELIKRDAETKEPLSGAEFELSSDDNTYTGKSNAQGSVVWNYNKDETSEPMLIPITELDIAAGEYTLTETRAPEKYKLITTEWTAKKTAAKGWETLPTGDETKTENGITKVYINNEKAPSAITITKTVTGNLGSKTKPFTFTVTLTDADNKAINFQTTTQNDSYEVDLTEMNKATFDLTDGGSITIDNLPVGAKLTIVESKKDLTESDGNNYTVSVKQDSANKVYDTDAGITVDITDTASTVAFTNDRRATLDTGILSDTPKVQNTLLAVTFAASVIGILAYLDRKRSKYDYRQ